MWNLPNGSTTLKANYSQGFKPPSFFALGFPIGGNPDLKPEESTNYELTLVQAFDDQASSLEVSVFRTEYQNLSISTPTPSPTSTAAVSPSPASSRR